MKVTSSLPVFGGLLNLELRGLIEKLLSLLLDVGFHLLLGVAAQFNINNNKKNSGQRVTRCHIKKPSDIEMKGNSKHSIQMCEETQVHCIDITARIDGQCFSDYTTTKIQWAKIVQYSPSVPQVVCQHEQLHLNLSLALMLHNVSVLFAWLELIGRQLTLNESWLGRPDETLVGLNVAIGARTSGGAETDVVVHGGLLENSRHAGRGTR